MPANCYDEWQTAWEQEVARHREAMANATTYAQRVAELDEHIANIQALKTKYMNCVLGGGNA